MIKLNILNDEEKKVILEGATEAPFSGKYNNHNKEGLYVCRQCNAYLYRSEDKFDSGCGWPSFDDEVIGAVSREIDKDGIRTEIRCSRCNAHLGHVFSAENLTPKNLRHCVNSVSMDFIDVGDTKQSEIIYLGGGCFWCIDAVFRKIQGVLSVKSGYAGGQTDNPKYADVCGGQTGHAEVVKVEYDPRIISLEGILDIFFGAHDPTTVNRQGNDVGSQYRSVVFTSSEVDTEIVKNYLASAQHRYDQAIVTEVGTLSIFGNGQFYEAEDYHQDYFSKNKVAPYCQMIVAPKVEKIDPKFLKKGVD